MLKTKLISLAAMSAITVGALAPMTSVGAAETASSGMTKGTFNITNVEKALTLDSVPNMNFGTIEYNTIKSNTAPSANLQAAAGRVTEAVPNDTNTIEITDTRESARTWNLTAVMTDFTGIGGPITTSGIQLAGDVTGTINKDVSSILQSSGSDDQEQDFELTTGTTVNLDRDDNLSTDAIGETFTSDLTWTLEDSLSF
ncbi:WxL domain-containing protein [Loigolactobacillus zhaoyuanensis]|uniref:WxL domain-containing protein n=1 Tax=Loigolactobacillus zhaoyuanensis TaxID=2486017 RepID=UPI000F74AA52|nr:WxL domain-containing protein [Loigolactobacillus zhaoyuanensis]